MGDIARGINCDRFIGEFEPDIVAKYRCKILDRKFKDKVCYYIGVDDVFWSVGLCATVEDEGDRETYSLVSMSNIFDPQLGDESALIDRIVELLDITEEEARRRLVKAGLIEDEPRPCLANSGNTAPRGGS